MTKEKRKTTKSIRLDDVHWQILEDLIPFYGSSPAEVVRNIVLMWLHDNLGGDVIKELEELNAIKLKKVKRGTNEK